VFESVEISLYDLARACMAEGKTSISDRTFRRCLVTGPAVMLVLDNVQFNNTNFGQPGERHPRHRPAPGQPQPGGRRHPRHSLHLRRLRVPGPGLHRPDLFLDQLLKLEIKA
jgi:hypothetical protein